jgi:vacuolar-type H+-ATPase subunit F/Vma7
MWRVAVLGERAVVEGWALGGAQVLSADSPEQVRTAWAALGADVAVVLLTPAAARALGSGSARRAGLLTVVLPP